MSSYVAVGPQIITAVFLLMCGGNLISFQEINFQGEGSILHYGQKLQHCTLAPLWNELKLSCEFSKARSEVCQFNTHNRWRKRGVAMIPTKFGISFTLKLMNQVMVLECDGGIFLNYNCSSLINLYEIRVIRHAGFCCIFTLITSYKLKAFTITV